MDGSNITSSQDVTYQGHPNTPGPGWSIIGTGDYTGDGKSDILLQNTSGSLNLWTMNGSIITSSQDVTYQGHPNAPGPGWQVLLG
jgi:hypothetical protein